MSCVGRFDISHQSAAVSYRGSFASFMLVEAAFEIETGGKVGSA